MIGMEMSVLGAVLLGISVYGGIRKLTSKCRVQLITSADTGNSRAEADGKLEQDEESTTSASLRSVIDARCPSLSDPAHAFLVPTPYLFTGSLQTGYSVLNVRRRDQHTDIHYDRETRTMPDNGTVSLDWYPPRSHHPATSTAPIAVVMVGGGGSSQEYHVRYLAKHLADVPLCYRVAVLNYRGCARTPLTSPQMYNGCHTDDIRDTVKHLQAAYPSGTPIVAIGFSLGANVITRATKVTEIESLVTARLLGCSDCWEYYRMASCTPFVSKIRIPYLAINSLDDPVVPQDALPVDAFRHNPDTALALVEQGGHLAFFTGARPRIWLTQPVQEFLSAVV
ncbi:AB-hydrolase YheT [Martensiomyces pterosporus]|nr:AB-hydrolase YheT [Martensiomyces pterosporus]